MGFAAASALLRMCLPALALGLLAPWAGCTPPQSEERVVAFVNGKPITQTEFDHEWADLPEATKARYEKEGGRQVFLRELVDHELLLQEARKLGLDQSDVIRDRVRRYKEKLLKDELLKDLETQVNRGGDFGKFAQRYSVDYKTKAKGGDLGPYRKGLVIPEVDDVIKTLRPGMVSAPIKTEAGYYLVQITALEPEIIQADQAKRERLRQELLYLKRKQYFDSVIAEIKAKAVVRLADGSHTVADGLTKR
jgi:peptidyl-prolyl cis-trans isomerase C